MTAWGVVLGLALSMLATEMAEVCPWLAEKLVRRAARRRYQNPEQASDRTEEWLAVLDSRPGKLPKLITALWFFGSAAGHSAARTAARVVVVRRSRRGDRTKTKNHAQNAVPAGQPAEVRPHIFTFTMPSDLRLR